MGRIGSIGLIGPIGRIGRIGLIDNPPVETNIDRYGFVEADDERRFTRDRGLWIVDRRVTGVFGFDVEDLVAGGGSGSDINQRIRGDVGINDFEFSG